MYTFNELLQIVEQHVNMIKYPQTPGLLYQPIAYALQSSGKRVRPVALLMACNLFRDNIRQAEHAALAVEIFHNFTLVHDDIMDRSPLRRGQPSVHAHWNDNVAILSGDAMLIYAYQTLCQTDKKYLPELISVFNEMAIGVCEGQQYDMDFELQTEVSVDQYLKMIRLKTALLLAAALKMGAICGEAEPAQAEALYQLGINIGLAFQVQDDLFDTYGDQSVLGKPIGGDIIAGKKTFLLTSALQNADTQTKKLLMDLPGNPQITDLQKVQAVRDIYDQLGVKQLALDAIEQYFCGAERLLHVLGVDTRRTEALRQWIDMLVKREK